VFSLCEEVHVAACGTWVLILVMSKFHASVDFGEEGSAEDLEPEASNYIDVAK
jgi:hypothetical protein